MSVSAASRMPLLAGGEWTRLRDGARMSSTVNGRIASVPGGQARGPAFRRTRRPAPTTVARPLMTVEPVRRPTEGEPTTVWRSAGSNPPGHAATT